MPGHSYRKHLTLKFHEIHRELSLTVKKKKKIQKFKRNQTKFTRVIPDDSIEHRVNFPPPMMFGLSSSRVPVIAVLVGGRDETIFFFRSITRRNTQCVP